MNIAYLVTGNELRFSIDTKVFGELGGRSVNDVTYIVTIYVKLQKRLNT